MNPKLSIGMPVYNGELFIERAIESILAQTFTDFELIISPIMLLLILHRKYVKIFQKRIIEFESLNRKENIGVHREFLFSFISS